MSAVVTPVCRYREVCSGCQLLDVPYEQQKESKIQDLEQHLLRHQVSLPEKPRFLSAGEFFLRDRLDFTLTDGRLGLFAKTNRDIVDLDSCLQLSPPLQNWLTEFRQICWPMNKASFRLRVSPHGEKGIWIDCANIDIKKLLEEANILTHLLDRAFVEIGQRRKVPVQTPSGYKLQDPQLRPWFETWMGTKRIQLYSHVASFTQPSLLANRLIAETIAEWMEKLHRPRVLEFGSGIGNLTFPALASADSVTACEIDELSLAGLRRTLQEQALSDRVRIHAGDFQKKLSEDFSQYDLILVNPPRSGLMNFLAPLAELETAQRPAYFIYMSCFPESLAVDLARLQKQAYRIKQLAIIDQFPQTRHYEVLCLLERE